MKVSKGKASSKKTVKANSDTSVVELVMEPPAATSCKYEDAVMYIRSAISSLSAIAKDDEIAKDSIANLSVVLFDLKGE